MDKCKWCGAPVPERRRRCDKCKSMRADYRRYAANISKQSPVAYLIEFRNLLYNLLYNMPGATELPYDIRYQYDRVNRYIALKDNKETVD